MEDAVAQNQKDVSRFSLYHALKEIDYRGAEPAKFQFGDKIVGIIEARDGTIMDVVRQVKPFEFS